MRHNAISNSFASAVYYVTTAGSERCFVCCRPRGQFSHTMYIQFTGNIGPTQLFRNNEGAGITGLTGVGTYVTPHFSIISDTPDSGIPTVKFNTLGTVCVNDVALTSDERLKENIQQIPNTECFEKINNLAVKKYNFISIYGS
jgi:hypothetical protein